METEEVETTVLVLVGLAFLAVFLSPGIALSEEECERAAPVLVMARFPFRL
jgi:hypothetical protein